MNPPKEAEPQAQQADEIIADIEKRGTIFEFGGLSVTSDGHWHFFFNDKVLVGPLCGEAVEERENPKEIPDDALICRRCIERTKEDDDLRKKMRKS